MPQPKTIRLRASVRSGHLIVPNNAVVDAAPEVADDLVSRDLAEYTDAIERYPNKPFLDYVNDVPVSGAEKFPAPPGVKPVVSEGLIGTEPEKHAEAEATAAVAPVWDHPEKTGDEASPAKPDASSPAEQPKGSLFGGLKPAKGST